MAPVGLTIWLIWTVVGWIDGFVLHVVPNAYQPDRLLQTWLGLDETIQINIRGIGLYLFWCSQSLSAGWPKGMLGRSLIRFAEGLVERTPVVRSIYSGIKQISETILRNPNAL